MKRLDDLRAENRNGVVKTEIQIELDKLDTLRNLGMVDDEEYIARKRELDNREYQLDLENLQRKLKFNDQTELDKQQTLNEIDALNRQHTVKEANYDNQLLELKKKNAKSLRDVTKNSLTDQITDLVMFQTTWKKAFENFGKAILQEVVKQKAAELAAWIMGENTKKLLKTTNNTQELVQVQTNQAAIQGVRTAGYATDLAAATAHNAAVKASAGAMAISVVGITQAAFQATIAMLQAMVASIAAIPPVGPALAASMQAGIVTAQGTLVAAGTTATGAITSMMTLPSFDVGTWEVPQDMVAQVHKGEPIIPAPFAPAAKKLLTGEMVPADLVGNLGAPNINLTLHASAIDSKGIKEVLQKESQTIVGIIRKEYRNFNPAFRSR